MRAVIWRRALLGHNAGAARFGSAPADAYRIHETSLPMTDRSPGTLSAFLPVALLIVAMASIQMGAALAKQLFPIVGSTVAPALRLLFVVLLCAVLARGGCE